MWRAAVFEVHSLSCVKGSEATQRPEGSLQPVDLEQETNQCCFTWWCMTTLQEQRTQPFRTQGCELCCGNSADQTNVQFLHKTYRTPSKKKWKDLNNNSAKFTKKFFITIPTKKRDLLQLTLCYITCAEWKQRPVSSHITNVLPFPQSSERTHLQLHTNPTTSELTTTRPQLPSLVLSLQPQKPQPTSTTPTLIIHGSRKSIHPQTVPSAWGVGLRFTRAHRCAQATDLLIWRTSPLQTTGIPLWGPPISLFLIFLVFFPQPNHHYLDKLLTLREIKLHNKLHK